MTMTVEEFETLHDVTLHEHENTAAPNPARHRHAGGSIPHTHLLRSICLDPRCQSYGTHDIHPFKQ